MDGVEYISQMAENTPFLYFKLFALLYADDIVILAEKAKAVKQRLTAIFLNECKLESDTRSSAYILGQSYNAAEFYFDNIAFLAHV